MLHRGTALWDALSFGAVVNLITASWYLDVGHVKRKLPKDKITRMVTQLFRDESQYGSALRRKSDKLCCLVKLRARKTFSRCLSETYVWVAQEFNASLYARHFPLSTTSTKLYCLVTEAHVLNNFPGSLHSNVPSCPNPGFKGRRHSAPRQSDASAWRSW